MAIPYPYNRLGINAGGTVTPIEPIEGSQGVFWYANGTNNLISSAMQMVNKTLLSNNRIDVWNSGYLINPYMGDNNAYIYVHSGGTALRVYKTGGYYTWNDFISVAGVASNISVDSGDNFDMYCGNSGYVENVNIIGGSKNYLNVSMGMANSVYLCGNSNGIVARNNATVYNVTNGDFFYSMSGSNSVGYRNCGIKVFGTSILVSNVYALPGSLDIYQNGPFFSVYIGGDSSTEICTSVELLNFNLGKYGLYDINGFGTSVKLTGNNENGSLWLSNNTLHNMLLREWGNNYIQVKNSDSVFIDTLFIPGTNARLLVNGSSAYYCGNNITKRTGGCLQYPYRWDSFSINGFADEGGSFGYSNGTGSNIVFGGYSYYTPVITLYGEIIEPYLQGNTVQLYSGTLISPHIHNCVELYTAASIINYPGGSSDYGSIDLMVNGYYSTVSNPTGSTMFYIHESDAFVSNIDLNQGASQLYFAQYCGTALNITQGTDGKISLNSAICKNESYVRYNTDTYFFTDYRVINGTNPYGSFWYSNGTFYNPYVIGSYYSYYDDGPLKVDTGASVLGGNIGQYYRGHIYLRNGGYVSGLTIHTSGILSIAEAAYQTAPTAIDITQFSGGNILPGGVWKYYGQYSSSSTSNGLPPVVYGVNEFGGFSQKSGILYNWAFYDDSCVNTTFSNRVDNIHGATSLHLNGEGAHATMTFSCYALSNYDSAHHPYITDITLDNVYLSKHACIQLCHIPSEFKINAGTFYITDIGSIILSGSYSTAVSQYPYTGVTINCVNYLNNQNNYVNTLMYFSAKDYISTVNISSNANLNINGGTYGIVNVESGGCLINWNYRGYHSGISASISVASGGFLYIAGLSSPYIYNLTGETERGGFIVSGNYISNLLYNIPPNRTDLLNTNGYVSAYIAPEYTVNNICVSNNNRLYVAAVYGALLSAYGGTISLDGANSRSYVYIHASSGYVSISDCTNVSYIFLNEASASFGRFVTASYITVNSAANLNMSSSNAIVYGDVNSGGIIYVGYSSPYIQYGSETYYDTGRYNYVSAINIQSGGTLGIGRNCSADDLRVNLGGTLIVDSYGTALNVISNGGANIISMNGAYITYAS